MVSILNLSSGIGMVAVAAIAAWYWYAKKRPKLIYFVYGAIFWAIAIAIKVAMDLTISQPFYAWLLNSYQIPIAVLGAALYLGLRTGILENGVTYLGVKYTKLKEMSFNDAVAVGIGFGGVEALILGVLSLLTVATLLLNPGLLSLMPLSSQEQFGPLFIPIPIIERIFTLFCHVFATVLAIYAAKLADLKWLGLAIIYKALLDGSLPYFSNYLGYLGASEFFYVEAYVAIMGLIGLAGIYWLYKKYGGAPDARQAGNTDTGH